MSLNENRRAGEMCTASNRDCSSDNWHQDMGGGRNAQDKSILSLDVTVACAVTPVKLTAACTKNSIKSNCGLVVFTSLTVKDRD